MGLLFKLPKMPQQQDSFSSPIRSETLLEQSILGSRRPSNYLTSTVVTIGGLGFSLASVSSFYGKDFLPIGHPSEMIFVPQGLILGIYGLIAAFIAIYLWLLLSIDFGSGINRFDKTKGLVEIYRRGLFKEIKVDFPIKDVKAVKLEVRDGINPKSRILLRVQGRSDLPLTSVGSPPPLVQLEKEGAELARFIGVNLEGA